MLARIAPLLLVAAGLAPLGCAPCPTNAPVQETVPTLASPYTETGEHETGSTQVDLNAHPGSSRLEWIADDYPRAVAKARTLGVPLVIDFWAEWCHTCLSMKHTVLADAGLRDLATRFVWLAIDTEQPNNAQVVEQFPPVSWPTFFVIDPDTELALARLSGGAAVGQFRSFLLEAEDGHIAAREAGGSLPENHPLARLRHADARASEGDFLASVAAYDKLLADTPENWPRRVDAMVLRLRATNRLGDFVGCANWVRSHLAHAGDNSATTEFVDWASQCTDALARTEALHRDTTRELIAFISTLVQRDDAPLSADDRSELLRVLRELHVQRGELEPARQAAQRQRDLLDQAAIDAPTPYAASTYNWPRAEVYVYLGIGEQILSALRASVTALPGHYDPPYRLAWVLHQLHRDSEALPEALKALSLVHGPRRQRIEALIAELNGT